MCLPTIVDVRVGMSYILTVLSMEHVMTFCWCPMKMKSRTTSSWILCGSMANGDRGTPKWLPSTLKPVPVYCDTTSFLRVPNRVVLRTSSSGSSAATTRFVSKWGSPVMPPSSGGSSPEAVSPEKKDAAADCGLNSSRQPSRVATNRLPTVRCQRAMYDVLLRRCHERVTSSSVLPVLNSWAISRKCMSSPTITYKSPSGMYSTLNTWTPRSSGIAIVPVVRSAWSRKDILPERSTVTMLSPTNPPHMSVSSLFATDVHPYVLMTSCGRGHMPVIVTSIRNVDNSSHVTLPSPLKSTVRNSSTADCVSLPMMPTDCTTETKSVSSRPSFMASSSSSSVSVMCGAP
eukprot:PhM_4_TR7175/c0_g2_i1/m.27746